MKISVTTITAIVCALFVGCSWPWIIQQSSTEINEWINNPQLIQNVVILITIEICLQISFCILTARSLYSDSISKQTKIIYQSLCWFPGILCFPTLAGFLMTSFFLLPGYSFIKAAWFLALTIFIIIPLCRYLLVKLLPETDLRLELLFLLNMIIVLLSIIPTINGKTSVLGHMTIDLISHASFIGIALLFAIFGFLYYQHNVKKTNFL